MCIIGFIGLDIITSRVLYIYSSFPSNLIRASSVARTPSATTSPTTRPVLGGVPDNARVMGCTCANSPSKYSSTTLDGVPSRVSRLPNL